MATRRREMQAARQRKVARVLKLFRSAIPIGEFDEKDWASVRVATRLVYETEDLRVALRSKQRSDRDFATSYWIDSMESGIEFMSWVKCLASIVREVTYSKERGGGIERLWGRHHDMAELLLAPKMSPGRRLSLLVELGGIELTILGNLWWLEPGSNATRAKSATSRRPV